MDAVALPRELAAIDVHVGSRIRLRRSIIHMSQEELGLGLGITFQQVQKYERGVNRVGASRLFDLSRILDVSISFFFDDIPNISNSGHDPQPALSAEYGVDSWEAEMMGRCEAVELLRAFYRITDKSVRKWIFDLIKSMADT